MRQRGWQLLGVIGRPQFALEHTVRDGYREVVTGR